MRSIGRRGVAEVTLEWFPRLIMLAVAIVVIALLVRHYANRDVDVANVSIAAHEYRLYYGDVIMYQENDTKRVYPGIVDLRKFSDERIAETFSSKARLSSCLVLTSGQCPQFDETVCFNRDLYDLHLAQARLQGASGASVRNVIYPVTLKLDAQACPGFLNMTIVRPNQ